MAFLSYPRQSKQYVLLHQIVFSSSVLMEYLFDHFGGVGGGGGEKRKEDGGCLVGFGVC